MKTDIQTNIYTYIYIYSMGNEQSKNPERIEPRQLSKFQFGSIIKPKSDIFNPPFEFPEHHVTQKDIIGVVVSHIKRDPVDVSKPPSELYEWSFGDTTNSDAMEVVVALLDMKKTYAEMEANTNPKFFIMREDQIGKVSVSENFRKNLSKNFQANKENEIKDFNISEYENCSGPAGTIIFFDTNCPHFAGTIKKENSSYGTI